MNQDPIIEIKGTGGSLQLYGTFVRIDRTGSMVSFMVHGLAGKKDIYFRNISSIQIKEPGLLITGYIQFSLPGGIEAHGGAWNATQDENSVCFKGSDNYEKALKVKEYIEQANAQPTTVSPSSSADEIEKLHALMQKGVISQSEFEAKKKKLLGL